MKYKILLLFIAIGAVLELAAQGRVKLTGRVYDSDNQPIELATVRVAGTTMGTMTDLKGEYQLSIPAGDSIVVIYSCLGYREEQRQLLNLTKDVSLSVRLNKNSKMLSEVVVATHRRQTSTLQTIDTKDLKLMPDASGGSIEAMLTTFAGVNSSNELSSQYSVRGGNFDENIVYINGIEVYRPLTVRSGQQEGLSIINPDMVGAVGFSSGGFSAEELAAVEKRAYALGAKKHVNIDVTEEYYSKCIKYMVFGNVLRNKTYPISVSSERTFQAIAIINYAKEIGADYVAHGSTGAGNDQVRFDLTFQILAPEIGIITPTRDMTLTREYEIEYLKKHGYTADFKKMEYSINKGLWGTSIGGKETLKSNQTLPEEAYPSQMTATQSRTITLDFVKGEIAAIDGQAYDDKVKAIQALEAIASPYAIGRDMHIGDTIIGIKGRVGFEAAAPMLIIAAHKMLEKHTLTKWQQYWKDQVATWYGMFLHEAQYLEPVMRDIEAFLDSSQHNVTGRVIIELHPYRYVLVGIESDYDLMKSDFGEYGEVNKAWSADDVKGFTKILGNQMKIFYSIQNKNKK